MASTARSAEDAAASIGTPLGSIVKSLVFTVGGAPVMALVAGDRRCDTKALAGALGREGRVRRADADAVRDATGFAIGGVAPVAHETKLPVAIDASLGFETVYAAAGHPHCVFATTLASWNASPAAQSPEIAVFESLGAMWMIRGGLTPPPATCPADESLRLRCHEHRAREGKHLMKSNRIRACVALTPRTIRVTGNPGNRWESDSQTRRSSIDSMKDT